MEDDGFSDVEDDVVGCSDKSDVRVSPNLVAVVGLLRSVYQRLLKRSEGAIDGLEVILMIPLLTYQ